MNVETTLGVDVNAAVALLNRGDVVAIPTETVYGLAGNALSESAVAKIFDIKQRPLHNPLIIHIGQVDMLQQFCEEIPEKAIALGKRFWPGPLTMLLKKKEGLFPDIVNNGLPEVAIRMPNHGLTLTLLNALSYPLAAPSANPFGYISPTTPDHVLQQLGGKVPYILDGGPCMRGIESTIVRFEHGEAVILRPGAITKEELEAEIGPVRVYDASEKKILAPGMLASHYAPHTQLILVEVGENWRLKTQAANVGAIRFSAIDPNITAENQVILSKRGDLIEAGANLYAALHQLDAMGLDVIIAERLPNQGLGAAINDRLAKACSLCGVKS